MISGHLNPKPCPSGHPNHDRWLLFVVSFWEQLSPPCPVWSGRRRSDLPPSTSFESESGRRSHPKSHTLGLVDCAGKRPGRAGAPPDCQTGQSAISFFDPSSLVPAALATLKQTGGPTSRGRRAASVTQSPFPCWSAQRALLAVRLESDIGFEWLSAGWDGVQPASQCRSDMEIVDLRKWCSWPQSCLEPRSFCHFASLWLKVIEKGASAFGAERTVDVQNIHASAETPESLASIIAFDQQSFDRNSQVKGLKIQGLLADYPLVLPLSMSTWRETWLGFLSQEPF